MTSGCVQFRPFNVTSRENIINLSSTQANDCNVAIIVQIRLPTYRICRKRTSYDWNYAFIKTCNSLFLYLKAKTSKLNVNSRLSGLIVGVTVVLRKTVAGDIDRSFERRGGSHHKSQVTGVCSVYGIERMH